MTSSFTREYGITASSQIPRRKVGVVLRQEKTNACRYRASVDVLAPYLTYWVPFLPYT